METLQTDYGLWGLLIYVAIKEIWPFFRDMFFPAKMKFEQTQEARVTAAIEGIKDAMSAFAVGLTTNNERISTLTEITIEHIRLTNEAVTAMLVKTNTIPQRKKSRNGTSKSRTGL